MATTEERYADICERIRQHCRQRNWYGPDGATKRELSNRDYLDTKGKLRTQEIIHCYHRCFEFFPATEKQLRLTEQILGVPLPPLLRTIYARIANGGFGPGRGITGARDGYFFGYDYCYETIDKCRDTQPGIRYVDLADYNYPQLVEMPLGKAPVKISLGETSIEELPCERLWVAHLLHICHLRDGVDSYIENKSGQVYGSMLILNSENKIARVFYKQEPSLEDWIEHWLQDQMQHWFEWDENAEAKKVVIHE